MAEEVIKKPEPEQQPDAGAEQPRVPDGYVPRERLNEVLTKVKQLEAAQSARQKEQEQAEEARMAKQAEWQQLAEKRSGELEAAQSELETLRADAEQYRTTLQQTIAARLETVPEQLRSLVPEYDDPAKVLAWLDANADKLVQPTAPPLDPGPRGDGQGKPSIKLSRPVRL